MAKSIRLNGPKKTFSESWLSISFWQEHRSILLRALVIAGVTAWIYWPAHNGAWLWDDQVLVNHNLIVRDPAGWWKIWLEPTKLLDYQPAEVSVVWIEWRLWHEHTAGYHLVNVLLHILSAFLLWRLFTRLGLRWAWLGGLLFAVHPLMVESVAWISELKNTLSLPPFLLAMIAWIDFEEKRRPRDYDWALGLFLMAMLAKTTMVMFPVMILLYAWWKKGHLHPGDFKASAPFFVVSFVMGLVTLFFLHHNAIINHPIPLGGIGSRLVLGGLSLSFYFSKFFLPLNLLPIYPQWPIHPGTLLSLLPWPVLAGIVLWCWTQRKTWGRHALLGLGFFIIFLLPFLGFTGGSYMSFTWVMDHILYLPVIGLIGLVAAGLAGLEQKLPVSFRPLGFVFTGIILLVLAMASHGYAALYQNEQTLWTYTIRHNPGSFLPYNYLGVTLEQSGHPDEAIENYRKSLQRKSDYGPTHYNLGLALYDEHRDLEAIDEYQASLQLEPRYLAAHCNLGLALMRIHRLPEAIEQFQKALAINPLFIKARDSLGVALSNSGRVPEAIPQFQEVLRIDPNLALTHYNLGLAYTTLNRVPEAIEQFEQALRLQPRYVDAHINLGAALYQTGHSREAADQFRQALEINPANPLARANLDKLQAAGF